MKRWWVVSVYSAVSLINWIKRFFTVLFVVSTMMRLESISVWELKGFQFESIFPSPYASLIKNSILDTVYIWFRGFFWCLIASQTCVRTRWQGLDFHCCSFNNDKPPRCFWRRKSSVFPPSFLRFKRRPL